MRVTSCVPPPDGARMRFENQRSLRIVVARHTRGRNCFSLPMLTLRPRWLCMSLQRRVYGPEGGSFSYNMTGGRPRRSWNKGGLPSPRTTERYLRRGESELATEKCLQTGKSVQRIMQSAKMASTNCRTLLGRAAGEGGNGHDPSGRPSPNTTHRRGRSACDL